MSPVRLVIVEPELHHPAPRPVRLTQQGRRELLYPIVAVLSLLTACAFAYAGRPSPGAMMPLFVALVGLGLYLVIRLLEAWHERVLLVREGRPAPAIVVSVSAARDGKARFVGWYEVAHKQWSIEWTDHRDSAEIGDAVTALYLPSDPGRALIYRVAGCEAVAADADPASTGQSPVTPSI